MSQNKKGAEGCDAPSNSDAIIPALGNTKQEPEKVRGAKHYSITIFFEDEKVGWGRFMIERFLQSYKCVDKVVWQTEMTKTEKRHLQVAMSFKNSDKRNFDKIKKVFPTANIQVCRKWENAISYCCKTESRVDGPWFHNVDPATITEWGSIPTKNLNKVIIVPTKIEREPEAKIPESTMKDALKVLRAQEKESRGWVTDEEFRKGLTGRTLKFQELPVIMPQSPVATLPLPVEAKR